MHSHKKTGISMLTMLTFSFFHIPGNPVVPAWQRLQDWLDPWLSSLPQVKEENPTPVSRQLLPLLHASLLNCSSHRQTGTGFYA